MNTHDGGLGYLKEESFMSFFINASKTNVSTVWQNLKSAGIRNDLKHVSEIVPETVQEHELPRGILVKDSEKY